ncbi:MAG: hypothetical protein WCP06_04990 [Verrucomicrobiota bacterium]
MHRITILLIGCSLALGSLCAVPVDFTPRPHLVELDGVPFHDIKFLQGKTEIYYRPPQGWVASGSPEHACFQSSASSSVRVEFTHIEGTQPPAWDEEGLKALRERAQATIPQVKDLKLIGELRSPLRIDGHETMAFTFSGVVFAQNYKFFLLVLPLETEQFNFLLYANEKEFGASSKLFLNSLFGLQWHR